jgi:hypothetical protein
MHLSSIETLLDFQNDAWRFRLMRPALLWSLVGESISRSKPKDMPSPHAEHGQRVAQSAG